MAELFLHNYTIMFAAIIIVIVILLIAGGGVGIWYVMTSNNGDAGAGDSGTGGSGLDDGESGSGTGDSGADDGESGADTGDSGADTGNNEPPPEDPDTKMLKALAARNAGEVGSLADYIFIQGADQWGMDIIRPAGFTEATPPETIAQRCKATGRCIAFNHAGYLKHTARLNALNRYPDSYSSADWQSNPRAGLYVSRAEARRQYNAGL